ncbi:GH24091, partial [Drosophila grimshawi]
SSSSHGSSTAASSSSSAGHKQQLSNDPAAVTGTGTGTTSSSSAGSGNHNNNNNNSSIAQPGHDELFLLYRLVRQRHIYHGHNAKSQAAQRKKTVLIPQEFSGYFSLLNEKGLPTATVYNSLMQLVRERVYKFASVDNMPAFTESTPHGNNSSPNHEGCLPSSKSRPQYVKTTARGGQVFRLLAVFEDGKQEHGHGHGHGQHNGHQKSMSLQNIELLNGQRKEQRPDLLAAHAHTDAISEAGTELDDVENQTPPPQSFITEKLYNEFHVKTRQYSKSSSSLHQLRHFSLPQKLQLHETEREKRSQQQFRAQLQLGKLPITGRRAAGGVSLLGGLVALSPAAQLSPTSLVEDDLPYSSVRDSLVVDSLESGEEQEQTPATPAPIDYTKENIYAEICASHTCESFSGATQLTQLPQQDNDEDDDDDDDDGDYASLRYQPNGPQSVSRVEINCTPTTTSAISYHTVYLGEEALGERHVASGAQHITTVELAGEDNIYNTLK